MMVVPNRKFLVVFKCPEAILRGFERVILWADPPPHMMVDVPPWVRAICTCSREKDGTANREKARSGGEKRADRGAGPAPGTPAVRVYRMSLGCPRAAGSGLGPTRVSRRVAPPSAPRAEPCAACGLRISVRIVRTRDWHCSAVVRDYVSPSAPRPPRLSPQPSGSAARAAPGRLAPSRPQSAGVFHVLQQFQLSWLILSCDLSGRR